MTAPLIPKRRIHDVVTQSGWPYLTAMVVGSLLARVAQYAWQYISTDIPVIAGQAPGIYVGFFGFTIAAVLWFMYQGRATSNKALRAFLLLLAAGALAHIWISSVHGDAMTYESSLLIPVAIGLLIKTPTKQDVLTTLGILGWAILITLVLTRSLELLGAIPMLDVGSGLRAFEIENYWLPLSGWIGPEGRWPGPYGHNSDTGYAAAMLVVIGASRHGLTRFLFLIVGIAALVITGSRSSQAAAAMALSVIAIAFFFNLKINRRWKVIATLAALTAAAMVIAGVIMQSPNLTGRFLFWELSINAWKQSPLIGIGSTGMALSDTASIGLDAHNIAMDALLKNGAIGLIFLLAILTLCLWLTAISARNGDVLPLAMLSLFVVMGISEADITWSVPSPPLLWLMLTAIQSPADSESEPEFSVGPQLQEHSSRIERKSNR